MKKFLLLSFVCLLFSIALTGQSSHSNDSGFYETDAIRQINITFKQKNWRQVLDSLRTNGDNLLVGKAVIDGTTYKNVGVKYRGNRSFSLGAKRNPLNIRLNFIDKNQAHQGYKSIKLSTSLRDPSMIREVLGFEIARKYMIAPKANYAQVNINGEYYGLFVNVEPVGDEFLIENFGSNDNSFFKCSPNLDSYAPEGCKKNVFASLIYEDDAGCYLNNYELESESGWDDLIQLTRTLEQNPKQIGKILNVDRTLWMLAFNNVLVNLSSYSGKQSQNYFLYKDTLGQFTPIIWDLNLAFGSYKSATAGSDLRLKQLQELDPLLHLDDQYKPLISQLLKDAELKKIYLSHVRTIVKENFSNGAYEKRAETLQRMIQVPFINDKNREYSYEEFKNSLKSTIGKKSRIPGIEELMSRRVKVLRKHPELRAIPPEISEVKVLGREQYATAVNSFTIVATVSKRPKKVILMYRHTPNQPFKAMEMMDNGKAKDGSANDGTYAVTVEKGATDQLEYYIVAENAAAINFSPSNYMFKLYEANITELN